jgi:hypothetical protein
VEDQARLRLPSLVHGAAVRLHVGAGHEVGHAHQPVAGFQGLHPLPTDQPLQPRLAAAIGDTVRGLWNGLGHLAQRPLAAKSLAAMTLLRFCYGALTVMVLAVLGVVAVLQFRSLEKRIHYR